MVITNNIKLVQYALTAWRAVKSVFVSGDRSDRNNQQRKQRQMPGGGGKMMNMMIDNKMAVAKKTTTQLQPPNTIDFSQRLERAIDKLWQCDQWRTKLLKHTGGRVVTFEAAFPDVAHCEYRYVGAGSYAEVFRRKKDGVEHIIKLIRVYSVYVLRNLDGTSSRSCASTYRDAFNECKVSMVLSNLNFGFSLATAAATGFDPIYLCPLFPVCYERHLLSDSIPKYFDASGKYQPIDYGELGKAKFVPKEEQDKEEDDEEEEGVGSRPELQQLKHLKHETMAIVMDDAGVPMFDIIDNLHPLQVLSMLKQLILGLVVAEEVFEFEHRDLHMGNILVKRAEKTKLTYVLDSECMTLSNCGRKVTLIDTTFARLKFKGRVYYKRLDHLFEKKDLATAIPNEKIVHQADAYNAMAMAVKGGGGWSEYCPRSNHAWMCYIVRKFTKATRGRQWRTRSRPHQAGKVKEIIARIYKTMLETMTMRQVFDRLRTDLRVNQLVPVTFQSIPVLGGARHEQHSATSCSTTSSEH